MMTDGGGGEKNARGKKGFCRERKKCNAKVKIERNAGGKKYKGKQRFLPEVVKKAKRDLGGRIYCKAKV